MHRGVQLLKYFSSCTIISSSCLGVAPFLLYIKTQGSDSQTFWRRTLLKGSTIAGPLTFGSTFLCSDGHGILTVSGSLVAWNVLRPWQWTGVLENRRGVLSNSAISLFPPHCYLGGGQPWAASLSSGFGAMTYL